MFNLFITIQNLAITFSFVSSLFPFFFFECIDIVTAVCI